MSVDRAAGEVPPLPVSPGLLRVARIRVAAGFVVSVAAFWLARPTWQSLAVGGTVGLVGESLRFWAAGHLEKEREVTSSGPYRWMRHPLYVGSALLGIGFAVAARHVAVALLVVLYLGIWLSVAVRLEETVLRAKFGDEYGRYVDGADVPTLRRFSLDRVRRNREPKTVLGVVVAQVLLAAKIVIDV